MHKLLSGLILFCLILASLPGAMGVITYGGANVESNVGAAVAEGDAFGLSNGALGAIGFASGFAGILGGLDPLVIDPRVGVYDNYAHAYIYSGVSIPAASAGNGRAEFHDLTPNPVSATANDVLPSGDQIQMMANVDGGTVAAASTLSGDSTALDTMAESLISAWAGEATQGVPVPVLRGYAQITSRTQIDGTGNAVAGTTSRLTTGAGPVGQATANFAAVRVTSSGQTPAKILGNVAGTTNVESQNTEDATLTAGGEETFGYATINTFAESDALQDSGAVVGARSYSKSEIRSSGFATRADGNDVTSTTSEAVGSAESQAWDPDRNWNEALTAGTESATSSVSGYTSALAEALRGGDTAFGVPVIQQGLLNINPGIGPNNEGQVWSQVLSAAGNEMDIFGNQLAVDQRDVISLTYSSAYVERTGASRPDGAANAVKAYTYIGNGAEGWTSPGSAIASAKESGMTSQTSLENVLQSSGAHQVSQSVVTAATVPANLAVMAGIHDAPTGSMAGMVARTTYMPGGVTGFLNEPVSAQLGFDNPLQGQGYSGLITHGPGFTFNEFDAAGSLIIAGTEDAMTVAPSGTYRATATPVRVQEWIVGNDMTNNLYFEQRPTLTTQYPQSGTSSAPEVTDQRGNPDFAAWRTTTGGPV